MSQIVYLVWMLKNLSILAEEPTEALEYEDWVDSVEESGSKDKNHKIIILFPLAAEKELVEN